MQVFSWQLENNNQKSLSEYMVFSIGSRGLGILEARLFHRCKTAAELDALLGLETLCWRFSQTGQDY